jgi:hypothetical protein
MEAKPPMIEVQTPLDVCVLLFSAPDFSNERMPYVVRVCNIIGRKLTLMRYQYSNGRLKRTNVCILNSLRLLYTYME